MVDKLSHSCCFGLGIARAVIVPPHVVPVVGHIEADASEIAPPLCRVVMILHYGSHCRSDTSHERTSGNIVVERPFLTPCRSGEHSLLRRPGGSGTHCHASLRRGLSFLQAGSGFYLLFHPAHHPPHCRRNLRHHIGILERIAQHRGSAVVGRYYDKTLAICRIKHIVHRLRR